MTDLIERYDRDGVTRLVLNSPDNFNALSTQMIAALRDALGAIATDDSVRCVILSGAGKAFCAGHDLRQMQAARAAGDGGRAEFAALFADCAAMMQQIPALPQPVIAQVHGIATAAGCQLAASCDMITAAHGTRFGVNGVNIGLFCSTPMVALTRAIPAKLAFEMLTTGDFIDADRAHQAGLVNHVFAAESLAAQTQSLARKLADKLPAAIRMGKAAFHDQLRRGLPDAYDSAGAVMCENVMLPDTDEGIAAFLEKRRPDWKQTRTPL